MSAEFDRYSHNYDALLKDPIRDGFARDSSFFHLRKWLLLQDFFRRRRSSTTDLRWLDLGCGKGELLRLGLDSFRAAWGCDPSLEMLKECSDLQVRHQPQAAVLPFDNDSFDVVTAACVYHHLNPEERHAVAKEARRVLRPGGTFAVFEHNPWNPATRVIVRRTPVDAHAVLLTAWKTRRIMKAAGLTPVSTRYYLYLPERVFAHVSRLEKYLARIPAGGQYAVFGLR